jgi:hypothetical protein
LKAVYSCPLYLALLLASAPSVHAGFFQDLCDAGLTAIGVKKNNPSPQWPFTKAESVEGLPNRIGSYLAINNGHYKVEKVLKGQHGGERLVVRRLGQWTEHDNLFEDLRLIPTLLGQDAWFLGFRWLDDETAVVPNVEELNGALEKLRHSLRDQPQHQLSLKFYEVVEGGNKMNSTGIVRRFVDESELPIYLNERYFQDISQRALEELFVNPQFFETAQRRASYWLEFAEAQLQKEGILPAAAQDIRTERLAVTDYMLEDLQGLRMIPLSYLTPAQRKLLGYPPASPHKARFALFQDGLDEYVIPSIVNKDLREKFRTDFLQTADSLPESVRPLPYELGEELLSVEKMVAQRSEEKRLDSMSRSTLAASFVARLMKLRTLADWPKQ